MTEARNRALIFSHMRQGVRMQVIRSDLAPDHLVLPEKNPFVTHIGPSTLLHAIDQKEVVVKVQA